MKTKWITHPVVVFIFSLVALMASLFLYIHWYLKVSDGLEDFILQYKIPHKVALGTDVWIIILVLSLLVAAIIVGFFIIFIYYQKINTLYKMQKNFFDGFTHELKTPLASLRLFLDAFSKHEIPREEEIKYLDMMNRDIDRLSTNVSRILDLAKLESGNHKFEFKIISVPSVIKKTFSQYNIKQDNTRIEFKLENHSSLAESFYSNRILLEMLFSNLISNSIKYNQSDPIKISINLYDKNQSLIIQVKDNGIGIPSSKANKLFSKFYGTTMAYSSSHKSSGLGLYIVSLIIKLHKGKVSAKRNATQGSTFTLKFPVKQRAMMETGEAYA